MSNTLEASEYKTMSCFSKVYKKLGVAKLY